MTGANAVTRLTGFLNRIFLSRYIGAEGLGVFALVSPIYAFCCAIVASGIPVAAMKTVSAYTAGSEDGKAKRATCTCLVAVALIALILSALLILFASPISIALGDVRTKPSIYILAFAVLITGFENVYKSSFYSMNNVTLPGIAEISEQIFRITLVAVLLLTVSHGDITRSSAILMFGTFAGEALSFVILSVAYFRSTKTVRCVYAEHLSRDLFSTAAPVTLARTAETLISSVGNVLFPALLVSYGLPRGEALSVLGVISGMVMPLLFLPCLFTNALCVNIVPFISSRLARGEYTAVIRKTETCLFITALFTFPCASMLILYAVPIAERIFGDSRVALFLPPMAIGGVIATFRHLAASVLNACGKASLSSLYSFLGNVIHLALLALFVPFFGMRGYIIAYVGSHLLMFFPTLGSVFFLLHMDRTAFFRFLLPIFPCAGTFFFAAILYHRLSAVSDLLPAAVISAFCGVIVYLFGAFFFFRKKKIIFLSKIP